MALQGGKRPLWIFKCTAKAKIYATARVGVLCHAGLSITAHRGDNHRVVEASRRRCADAAPRRAPLRLSRSFFLRLDWLFQFILPYVTLLMFCLKNWYLKKMWWFNVNYRYIWVIESVLYKYLLIHITYKSICKFSLSWTISIRNYNYNIVHLVKIIYNYISIYNFYIFTIISTIFFQIFESNYTAFSPCILIFVSQPGRKLRI